MALVPRLNCIEWFINKRITVSLQFFIRLFLSISMESGGSIICHLIMLRAFHNMVHGIGIIHNFQIVGSIRSFITNCHIHNHSGYITFIRISGLPSIGRCLTSCILWITVIGRRIIIRSSSIIKIFITFWQNLP